MRADQSSESSGFMELADEGEGEDGEGVGMEDVNNVDLE